MDRLKSAGLKVTTPRSKILQVLENSTRRHLSAEDIHLHFIDQGDSVGLATIYRVLAQLEMAGLVERLALGVTERALYEICTEHHHDHLICRHCGRIEEFCSDEIEQKQYEIAANFHFITTHHQLNIFGWCEQCQPVH